MEASLILLIPLAVYLLPVIIAFIRGHDSRWGILIMTLFLGWTMFFWLFALIWSASSKGSINAININNVNNGK